MVPIDNTTDTSCGVQACATELLHFTAAQIDHHKGASRCRHRPPQRHQSHTPMAITIMPCVLSPTGLIRNPQPHLMEPPLITINPRKQSITHSIRPKAKQGGSPCSTRGKAKRMQQPQGSWWMPYFLSCNSPCCPAPACGRWAGC